MPSRPILKTTLCLALFAATTGCGKSGTDSDSDSGTKCPLEFDTQNPESSGDSWTYTAPVPESCADFFTQEKGTVGVAVKSTGIENEHYTLKQAELTNETTPLVFPTGLSMEGGTIDLKIKSQWELPLATSPREFKIIVVSTDGSSPANSIESLTATLSIND